MEEARWKAVFPGDSTPVLMLRAECSPFALKPAHSSLYLPTGNLLDVHDRDPVASRSLWWATASLISLTVHPTDTHVDDGHSSTVGQRVGCNISTKILPREES
jgi:hypothetical protein